MIFINPSKGACCADLAGQAIVCVHTASARL